METTIDSGGRVVIPKGMRDRIGLRPGVRVEVVEVDQGVEIRLGSADVGLAEVDGLVVASGEGLPPLTDEVVRDTIERTRR